MDLLREYVRALRALRRSPAFTTVVLLTLALGIGANTTVFSIARSLFTATARYPEKHRLMWLSRGYPGYPQGGGNFTYAAYRDIVQQSTAFDSVAAYQSFGALAMTDGREPVRVNANYVSANYLDLLGAQALVGRLLQSKDDRWGEGDAVVVLSYGFWQRELGGRNVVGQVIHFNQQPFTVIGVLPASFRDSPAAIDGAGAMDAWLPLGMAYRLTGYSNLSDRNSALLWGIARVKAGVAPSAAAAEFATLGANMAKAYPATDAGYTLVAMPLQDRLVGQFYKPLWVLIGASLFILLICCANVANLSLARSVKRQHELAVRSALGASARRLLRELLAENVVLLIGAALFAVLIAVWAVDGVAAWGNGNLPALLEFHVDRWMLLGGAAISGLTLLLFGLGPALAASRLDPADVIHDGGRQSAGLRHRRAARLLIATEVSLAVVLLIGTGLLLKSFRRLTTIDLGFNAGNLLTLRLDLNSNRYDAEPVRAAFVRSLTEKLSALPEVQSVTTMGPGMPGNNAWVIQAVPEGRDPRDPRNVIMSGRYSMNPGGLANLGITLLRGRDFTAHDDGNSPLVAIVSESTAKLSWPGEDAIGKRFQSVNRPGMYTVIGVAADAHLRSRLDLADAAIGIAPGGLVPQLDVYIPYAQRPNRSVVLAVRMNSDAGTVTRVIKAALLSLDSTLPIYDVATFADRLAAQDQSSLALTSVTGAYAGLALFLSALGLFGVLADAVGRRTRELGIRMALGAIPRDLLVMIMREGLRITAAGLVAGLIAAALLTRTTASLLFGVSTADPLVYCLTPAVLLAVAALACYLPGRRAMKLDPLVALRHE
jgi:putative ABC transport system permease protein